MSRWGTAFRTRVRIGILYPKFQTARNDKVDVVDYAIFKRKENDCART